MNKEHKKILLCLAHMSGNEQKFVNEAFETGWVVPLGPNVDGFESDLSQYVKTNADGSEIDSTSTVVALSSGTAAVHLA